MNHVLFVRRCRKLDTQSPRSGSFAGWPSLHCVCLPAITSRLGLLLESPEWFQLSEQPTADLPAHTLHLVHPLSPKASDQTSDCKISVRGILQVPAAR